MECKKIYKTEIFKLSEKRDEINGTHRQTQNIDCKHFAIFVS